MWDIHRGYYIAKQRYKISLLVSKNISQVSVANEWNIFSTWEKKFCIYKLPRNVLFIIETSMKYQTIWLFFFWLWKVQFIRLPAIATVTFSRVKITCYFHMWRYHVFVWGETGSLSLSTASSQYPALGKDNIETTNLQNFLADL